ncbi:MAG: hypothetical protein J6L00_04695 [Clostridia bacterium]|nr:hypothetical protein [Clostridia bacterium]
MANLTPEQVAALLQFASAKLGISEQQLAKTVQTGDTSHLGLSPDTRQKLSGMLGTNPEALLQSPQVAAMLQNLLGDK